MIRKQLGNRLLKKKNLSFTFSKRYEMILHSEMTRGCYIKRNILRLKSIIENQNIAKMIVCSKYDSKNTIVEEISQKAEQKDRY